MEFIAITRLTGFLCVVIATLGRLWCVLYQCGYGSRPLVVLGPFHVDRSRLYVFNLMAAAGIGLATASFAITLTLVVWVALVFPTAAECQRRQPTVLQQRPTTDLKQFMPRVWPDRQLFLQSDEYQINRQQMNAAFADVIWLYIVFVLAQSLPFLHDSGLLPAFLTIP
jgi:hypothetical protein